MKKITLTFVAVISAVLLFAQSPQSFKYQSVIRDNSGNVISNQNVSFQISILQGSAGGGSVYTEIHDTTTNEHGLVNLEIGNGSAVSGMFTNIDWGGDNYFMQIELDQTGGANYQTIGVSQLLSVPYSMYSNKAKSSNELILTDENGYSYSVSVDTLGNLMTTIIWNCGDSLYDTRDGTKYGTILIGSQCWMSENLNIGQIINVSSYQTNNGIIEKYCYNNELDSCEKYGGFYYGTEMMEYTADTAAQGICPNGWHIPTDYEWKILEGIVDSQYHIGDTIWNNTNWRGLDAGLKLKATYSWNENGNGTDDYGFGILGTGFRHDQGYFAGIGVFSAIWTSTPDPPQPDFKWRRLIQFDYDKIHNNIYLPSRAISVRCIKDYTSQVPLQPSNPKPSNGSTEIGIDTILSWACYDPDGNDLFYSIYFGMDPNPPFITAGLPETYFDPGTLNHNTTYYWKVVAIDSYGRLSVSNLWNFTTGIFTCEELLVDTRDGQIYNVVQIGSECWMAENLNIGFLINGMNNQTNNDTIEKYCYVDLASNCVIYGGLYQWDELMQYVTTQGTQGICPNGWHIPTYGDWTGIVNFLGGVSIAGGKMKEVGTTHWQPPNTGATNESGFTALPGGRKAEDDFLDFGTSAYFYSSSEYNYDRAWYWLLIYNDANAENYDADKGGAFSVRCLQDLE